MQHPPRPLPRTTPVHHLEERNVDGVSLRPMRSWDGYEVDGQVRKVVGGQCEQEGQQE